MQSKAPRARRLPSEPGWIHPEWLLLARESPPHCPNTCRLSPPFPDMCSSYPVQALELHKHPDYNVPASLKSVYY